MTLNPVLLAALRATGEAKADRLREPADFVELGAESARLEWKKPYHLLMEGPMRPRLVVKGGKRVTTRLLECPGWIAG